MCRVVLLVISMLVMAGNGFAGNREACLNIPVPENNRQTAAKIELGKTLFFDRRLSGDGTMSCATCHDPEQGFSDGLKLSLNYPTTRNWRNSPTLVNVAWQTVLFHDGRAASLEEQTLFPLMSAFEMNQNLDYLEEEIRSVPEYVAAFTAVFGDGDVTRQRIAMAIAAFERTIVSCDAPLDRFLDGQEGALSPEAQQGYLVFTGKGKCATCHFGPAMADNRFHALNVPEDPEHITDPRIAATRRFVAKLYHFDDFRTITDDPGRYLITKRRGDWKAFRTPTLRAVSSTGPYMHNGVFATLEEVVEFFNGGGGPGNDVVKALSLSWTEKRQLIVFLEEAFTAAPVAFDYPKIP